MFVFVSWYILSRFLYPCGRDDGVVYRVGEGSPDGPDIQFWQHHCWDLADNTQTLPQELHLLRCRFLDARLCRWHSWLVGHQHRDPS